MKKNIFLILLLSGLFSTAQKNDRHLYDYLKGSPVIINSTNAINPIISTNAVLGETDFCNCWIERDSTWQVVPFDGSGGSGGPGVPPDYRNDDWSSPPILLPFTFCFYGLNYTSIYINNNGSISFDAPYSTYSADSFPTVNFKMIAPFWSDCDTRGALSGLVYFKLTPTALLVQWDHVGYFGLHDDLLNTYQVIITDGNDPVLDAGKNVSFCYRDMQWTTGDASSGVGGFGGVPATVGTNPGDTINFIQVGRYDQPGSYYNGPFGGPAGVDMLDNRSFSFSVCNATNVAPFLKEASLCDTINICLGDTANLNFEFYSPEQGQITSAAFNFFGMQGCSVLQNTPGNVVSITAAIIGQLNNTGYHTIDVTATDNGNPQQSATVTFTVYVKTINTNFTYTPNPAHVGDMIIFTADASYPDVSIWSWDDGSPNDTGKIVAHTYTGDGIFQVNHLVIGADCQNLNSQSASINILPVGINNVGNSLSANFFPNPTNGLIRLLAKDATDSFSLQISDIQGRIVFEDKNVTANDQIDISSFENGMYFFKLSNCKGEKKGVLIKQ